jgi:hypothetical protein
MDWQIGLTTQYICTFFHTTVRFQNAMVLYDLETYRDEKACYSSRKYYMPAPTNDNCGYIYTSTNPGISTLCNYGQRAVPSEHNNNILPSHKHIEAVDSLTWTSAAAELSGVMRSNLSFHRGTTVNLLWTQFRNGIFASS